MRKNLATYAASKALLIGRCCTNQDAASCACWFCLLLLSDRLLDRTQPLLPLSAKKPRGWTNEYVRHGTQTLRAALEIASGQGVAQVKQRRTSVNFLRFLRDVVEAFPEQDLHMVLDNLNIHKNPAAQRWLKLHPRVHFHYTPTHASWVNMVECFFSILGKQALSQSVHTSKRQLKEFLLDYIARNNENPGPFVWTKGPEKLQRIIEATKEYQATHPQYYKQLTGRCTSDPLGPGGVVSPGVLSNILLTPFDREMRLRGYQLTRYADDWVLTCKSAAEARAAVEAAGRILKQLGVELHPQKTRIVHVRDGFEFLGYKIKRGKRKLYLPVSKIRSQARPGALYAYPKEKSIRRFMDQVRQQTKRRMPLKTKELIAGLNPLLRGWGEYYKRAHVRTLFHRLDGWIVRRIWSHRYKRWRNGGWKQLPKTTLYREHGLVNLIGLIPSLASRSD